MIRLTRDRSIVFSSGELLVTFQVKVRAGMDSFHLFKAEWETEFYVCGCICVMRQFLMIVESVFLRSESQRLMPAHTSLFPFLEPVEFTTGAYEKLHFHLLEFTHTEDELTCHDLVTESFYRSGRSRKEFSYVRTFGRLGSSRKCLCAVSGRRYILLAPSAVDPISVENIKLNWRTSVQLLVPEIGQTILLSTII